MTKLMVLIVSFLWIFPSAMAYVLLLMHRTHVVLEYGKLLGLSKILKIEEFFEWESANPNQGYFVFLDECLSNFWTRLLRCPWCLSTWFAFILNTFVVYGLKDYIGIQWALVISWLWSFSASYVATLLYFYSISVYYKVFPPEKA